MRNTSGLRVSSNPSGIRLIRTPNTICTIGIETAGINLFIMLDSKMPNNNRTI